MHVSELLITIAVGLGFALLGSFVATRLRLPVIIGYLVAGIALGPFTPGFVVDRDIVLDLAEIGVVLMMFGVGLHFSIHDLFAMRRISLPGAAIQIVVATVLGVALAWAWGWSLGAGLVFGLALSVASTVVLLRALKAIDRLETEEGQIAVAWLLVEDIAMVLVLVLLPVLAPSLGGEGGDGGSIWAVIGVTFLKIGGLVALMLVVGRRVLPWLLRRTETDSSQESQELFTLATSVLAIGVAVGGAYLFDVSYALGAFLGGLVINESDLTRRAAREMQPLETIFVALFFVSVGMLFDPAVIVEEPLGVALVLLIILAGKSVAAYVIVRVLRYPDLTARIVAAALAQIGEFSFILAALGLRLGLISDDAQSLIVAGALLSIAVNPLMFFALTRVRPKRSGPGDGPAAQPGASAARAAGAQEDGEGASPADQGGAEGREQTRSVAGRRR